MGHISISLAENGSDVLMRVEVLSGQTASTEKDLEQAFLQSEFSRCKLVDNAFGSLAKILEDDAEQAEQVQIIAQLHDASLTVNVSPDYMHASLELVGAYGGKHIKRSDIIQLLQNENITRGIYAKRIDLLIERGERAAPGEQVEIDIAVGKKAINGKDGYIHFYVDDPSQRILKPKKIAHGKVDMLELGGVVHVPEGAKLAELVVPSEGIDGLTIAGEVIMAEPGKTAELKESAGSVFFDESKTLLVAAINGMPKHIENSVEVHNLYEIENVDVGTGNIRFDGSIFIKGNVGENIKLHATQDIVIGGFVEFATVIAKGNISVAQGIIGHQTEDEDGDLINSTTVEAQGSVTAQFIQYADISTSKDLNAVHYISHSLLNVAGQIWVGNANKEVPDGKLFGCHVISGGAIAAGILGSASSEHTEIIFDYWQAVYQRYYEQVADRKVLLIDKIQRINNYLVNLTNKHPDNTALITRVEKALHQHFIRLGRLYLKLGVAKAKTIDCLTLFNVHAHELIYSGVSVSINGNICQFSRRHEATKIQWQDDKISIVPLVAPPQATVAPDSNSA